MFGNIIEFLRRQIFHKEEARSFHIPEYLSPEDKKRFREIIKQAQNTDDIPRTTQESIKNESAYYRKMLLNGYIIKMDLSDVKEMIRLLRINANNLNQYARKANECGSVYVDDIRDLQQQQKLLWVEMRKILEMPSKLNE